MNTIKKILISIFFLLLFSISTTFAIDGNITARTELEKSIQELRNWYDYWVDAEISPSENPSEFTVKVKVVDKKWNIFDTNTKIEIDSKNTWWVYLKSEIPKILTLKKGQGSFNVWWIDKFTYGAIIFSFKSEYFPGDVEFYSEPKGFIESPYNGNYKRYILPFIDKIKPVNSTQKQWLSFLNNIATPKTVSGNPFVIGINGLFALLYLLLFYLTGALFNSYFQEKGNELSINTKMISYWTKFWSKVYIWLKKVLVFLRLEKISILKNVWEKIESITIKRSHKINILIGILVLGIINSIIVWSFDITSVNGWFVICLLIFATGLLTLLKDMILYLLVKKEDRGLKIELIPSGYILASVIALFVRITGIIPGTIFWSAVRMNTETTTAKRKVGDGRKLFIALLTAYTIGIIFWFSSVIIPQTTPNMIFWNRFVLLNYFSIATDTFFTLLPFGLFWWVNILKDKKLKVYWFIFIFLATFTLFHTVFNTGWDFKEVLIKFQNHNMNLFIGVLIFWMITLWGFWYFQFYRKTKKVDYSF
ncbi:MAG: hypothetical protein ACD_71C00114G0009 [uncultured bacterium (gcode 4)]|uniref:Uncharacterized protein n=1 Tax=uncultured bacterium (gcode 4) TaxID=1234023 RepID=K1Z5H7_9BACT|nr:MAG: hypothetical protein ACD_71C00114G0009 [uncultured bacterium (gcode 4)]